MRSIKTPTTLMSAVIATVLSVCESGAQEWPNKPVRVVVPFAAGGVADRVGRMVADEMGRAFKQQFYVENRVGGGGLIGSGQVLQSDPDGHTLMIGGQYMLGWSTDPKITYNPLADFMNIAMVSGETFALSAQASLSINSFEEFRSYTKGKTDPINVGTSGTGTFGELVVDGFRTRKIANINHIPYSSGARLLADFFGKHVPAAITPVSPILQYKDLGIVPLAVTSGVRVPVLKDIPTFSELGYPDFTGTAWFWISAPKNLPVSIATRINQQIRQFVAMPETRAQFERSALLSMDGDLNEVNRVIADELRRWKALADESGSRPK